jgi:glycerol-3-phosphate acyltransferase PlsX
MTEQEKQALLPVAVDAMGGERSPTVIVEGAVLACRMGSGPVTLVGDRELILAELDQHDTAGLGISVVHADEMIAMGENPIRAARSKRASSMHGCFELVGRGEACAAVSAGNSGAFLGVGLLTIRRMEKCDRPCFAISLPTTPRPTTLLDIGANVDSRATHLLQFALMGSAYASIKFGVERPTVALLSNGTESIKGTDTLREAHRLLTHTNLNYIGFVEGRDVPKGCADVIVTDGLVGNIVLKLCEGMVSTIFHRIRGALRSGLVTNLASLILKKSFKSLHDELDWQRVGAAPLLGLNAVALIGHGQTSPKAIANAITHARSYVASGLLEAMGNALHESSLDDLTNTSELPISQSQDAEPVQTQTGDEE